MNKSKIFLYCSGPIVFVFLFITVWFFNSNYSALNISDIKMMIEDNREPAITIPATKEQYFNKWKCFDVKSLEIDEAEIEYNGRQIVPYIQVNSSNHSFQFNVDPVIHRGDHKIIINKWKELIRNQKSVCIFAAYLQTDPDGTSVWYISKIKTEAGYWDFAN
jgi:hypothetical protein